MTTLNWIKSTSGAWLSLDCNLANVETTGVYVIWHGGSTPRTVRVGQGNIAARLSAHRNDREILAYKQHGLYVTWASVPAAQLDGVENYLSDLLKPLVGERFPNVIPIAVNSPW